MHSSVHGQGLRGPLLDLRGWKDDSGSQKTSGDVHGGDWHVHITVHSLEGVGLPCEKTPPARPVRGVRNDNKKIR